MGRWYWEWLRGHTDPATAKDVVKAMGGKVRAGLRP